jgi:3-hydroxyacyl-CoA dehydrogenase
MESAGFKMGPFHLMDLIGQDINYTVSCSLYEALGRAERLRPSVLQENMVKQGLLGKRQAGIFSILKTGKRMIFVTGGSGFLGSYILQELVLQGRAVRALRRKLSFPLPPPRHPG